MKKRLAVSVILWLSFPGMLIGIVGLYGYPTSATAAEKEMPYHQVIPAGLTALPVPTDNPMTKEKVELGKMLFFDTRLSKDKTVSCATCHRPEFTYAEPEPVSTGIQGQKGGRNAPSVINTSYFTSMFWDGREPDLEHQAGGPMENPIEMGANIAVVAAELNQIPEYKKRFQEVFGAPASKETITKAIAAFERTVLSGNSPYDQFKNGKTDALNADAKAGMQLFFGKALCVTCHTAPYFTNGNFVNAGVGMDKPEPDIGRMKVTQLASDRGAFRVPGLREASKTAPYMHNGSVATLDEAVKWMNGGKENKELHPLFKAMPKLTEGEIKQIVAFLKVLSGEFPIYQAPKLP